MSAAEKLPEEDVLALDSETSLIQGGMLAPPLACVTACDDLDAEPDIFHHADPECETFVENALETRTITTANGAYDMAVLAAWRPRLMPLIWHTICERKAVHDVILRQKLMDIGEGEYRLKEVEDDVWVSVRYGLSDLHARYFDEHLEKDKWRLTYGKARELPLEQWDPGQIHYAKFDAKATLKVHYAQQQQKLSRGPIRTYLHNESPQVQAAWALHLISCWGIRTDPFWVRKMLQQIQTEQIIRLAELQTAGLVKENESRTMAAAQKRMRDTLGDRCELTPKGLELYRGWWQQMKAAKLLEGEKGERLKIAEKRKLFDKGYVSLKGEVCRRTGDKTLIQFAEYGQFQTLYSKISKLQIDHLPIQTSFETLLETGRTSSFANKLIPNSIAIQNLPRKEGMRECFVPRFYNADAAEDRNVFVAVDYAMAELVSLAQVCFKKFGRSKLRDALNAGMDPHLVLAARILKIDYAEAHKRLKAQDPDIILARQNAKPVSFGFPGGLGIEKFIEFARTSYGAIFKDDPNAGEGSAQLYKKIWLEAYPEMTEYFEWISALCEAGGGYCDIKQFISGRVRGHIRYTVACNTLFQGLTADGAKAALVEATRRCYIPVFVNTEEWTLENGIILPAYSDVGEDAGGVLSAMYGSRIVNFVHDEIVGETKEPNCHPFAIELSGVMENMYQPFTPDVKINTEATAMRRWRKGAKPITHNGQPMGKGGILVPFEDKAKYAKKAA